ncbi:MAG: YwqG family protein [Angustibacter sp.]
MERADSVFEQVLALSAQANRDAARRRQASRGRSAQASLDAAVSEFGLDEYADRIVAAALPSARLVSQSAPAGDLPVGVSRLGGAPDLVDGTDWPVGADGPLSFIAQVDLAAVAACLPDGALPSTGLLSFFYDAETQPGGLELDDRAGWAVLFTADTGSLRRRPAPGGVMAFSPVALTPRPELTVPFGRTMEARGLNFDDHAWGRYFDLHDAFADDFQPHEAGQARHRMLGHPDAIQGDMRRQIEATFRGGVDLDAGETPELDEAAKRWQLLLQVDSDDGAEMMWGDTGRLFFWIPADALATSDFEAVFVQLQCF